MVTIQQRFFPADLRALASVMAAFVASGLMAGLSPLYIGALIDSFGFDESDAGMVMTVELVALAATLALVSRRLVGVDPFRLATTGCLIAIAGQLASLPVSSFATLLCVRALVGAGESLMTLAASMLISRSATPDRFVAIAMVGTGIAFTVLMAGCAVAIEHFGVTGMFLVGAGTCLALLPVFLLTHGRPAHEDRHAAPPTAAAHRTDPALLFCPLTIALGFVAAAVCLTFVGQAAWSFAERSGLRAGIVHANIGNWLAASNFLSVMGSIVAALLANRVARMPTVTLGMAATGLTNTMIVSASSMWLYLVPLLANGIAYGFSTPFLFGTAAKLDSRGTVIAYANGAVMLTQALTPYVAGVVISESSYPALGLVLGAISVVAIALIVPGCRRVIAQTSATTT